MHTQYESEFPRLMRGRRNGGAIAERIISATEKIESWKSG